MDRDSRGISSHNNRSFIDGIPVESASIVVRKVPLNFAKEQAERLFSQAGLIEYIYFPRPAAYFTTKYCFVKYRDPNVAQRAKELFDGYKLGDQFLQVVAYDPSYKFRHGPNVFAGRAGSGRRDTFQASVSTQETPTPVSPRRSPSPKPVRRPIVIPLVSSITPSFLNRKSIDNASKDEMKLYARRTLNIDENMLDDSDDEDVCVYDVRRFVADNVLLDSEAGFWSWLELRLRTVGPTHYTNAEIDRVLWKLPSSVRKSFVWILGAMRSCDENRFKLLGPFVCLCEQIAEAKEKCIALCCNYREPFIEFWEPMAPSEIRSSSHLLQYMRKMLIHFGPLRFDDVKLRLLIRSLTNFVQPNMDQLKTTDDLLTFLVASGSSCFTIAEPIIYLTQEHDRIFRPTPSTSKKDDGQAEGAGTSEKGGI